MEELSTPKERQQIIDMICSNLKSDGVNLLPVYRYEFVALAKVAKSNIGVGGQMEVKPVLASIRQHFVQKPDSLIMQLIRLSEAA